MCVCVRCVSASSASPALLPCLPCHFHALAAWTLHGKRSRQLTGSSRWIPRKSSKLSSTTPSEKSSGVKDGRAWASTNEGRQDCGTALTLTVRPSPCFRVCRQSNGLDFDDILGLTVALLQRVPDATRALQGQWAHVLVDEFQVGLCNGAREKVERIKGLA